MLQFGIITIEVATARIMLIAIIVDPNIADIIGQLATVEHHRMD